MRALIIDQCGNRAALPASRALRQDGWTVGNGYSDRSCLAGHSRAVSRTHWLPPASAGASALLAAVNRAIAQCDYEVVFSLDDVGVLALSERRAELDAVFPYGEHAGVRRAFDKLELTRESERAGFAVPRTVQQGTAELDSFGEQQLLVVKPRHTFLAGVDGHLRASVVRGASAAAQKAAAIADGGAEPIIQEHLQGNLMAFTALTNRDAQIVARVQQVSDRTWPLDVGISARAHTVAVDERLAGAAARLLEALGWFGLAQLQFICGRDGTPRLIDFNGRFYGSLALALSAGVNLPAAWARMASGHPAGPLGQARVGARYQWLAGDLRAGWASAGGLARLRGVIASLQHALSAAHSIWQPRDPLPAIVSLTRKLTAWMRRAA